MARADDAPSRCDGVTAFGKVTLSVGFAFGGDFTFAMFAALLAVDGVVQVLEEPTCEFMYFSMVSPH